jgi:hypothetical protein
MGIFGVKKRRCPENQWTTIISSFGAGMPAQWKVALQAVSGGNIGGRYVEKRYWWIFPQPPVTGQLTQQMTFQRYWINAIYSVKICPTTDVLAEID